MLKRLMKRVAYGSEEMVEKHSERLVKSLHQNYNDYDNRDLRFCNMASRQDIIEG